MCLLSAGGIFLAGFLAIGLLIIQLWPWEETAGVPVDTPEEAETGSLLQTAGQALAMAAAAILATILAARFLAPPPAKEHAS